MKTIYLTILALLTTFAFPALAETFPGAEATACDPARFTPVYGADGATVLYWLNPTCPNGQGGMDPDHPAFERPLPVIEEPGDDETDEELPVKA